MHELSALHSSLFLHATMTSTTIGFGCGITYDGSVGLGVVDPIGRGVVDGRPTPGVIGSEGNVLGTPTGFGGTEGFSVARAVHFTLGLPVVPGGHEQ